MGGEAERVKELGKYHFLRGDFPLIMNTFLRVKAK